MGLFRVGSRVLIGERHFVFQRKVDSDVWQLEEEATGRIQAYRVSEIHKRLKSGELVFIKSIEARKSRTVAITNIPQHLIDAAKVRRSYVKAIEGLANSSKVLGVAVRAVWERLKQPSTCPHPSTVERWRRRYRAAGDDGMALIAQTNRRGNRKPRYPDEVEAIVQEAIAAVYMTLERRSIQDVLERALVLVMRENTMRPDGDKLKLPTRQMLERRIAKISAYDRMVARHGYQVARTRFRSVKGHIHAGDPLERVEIDHTALDLIVVDDDTALPLGRPTLTACIDACTRCVVGVHIGFEPAGYLSVAQCLKHAMLPKDDLRELYPSIENDWPAYGVMSLLVVDNGPEFHSKSLESACFDLNIEIQYAPRKTGWSKPFIERFLGTINRSIAHASPGTTFRNIFEKDEYDPSKHAIVRFSVLKEVVHRWISDVYHQKPHQELGTSPASVWLSRIRAEDIRLPDDATCLAAVLGWRDTRMLTHKGIEYDALFYNSTELTELRKQYGEKFRVDICVDRQDLGHIFVLKPETGEPIRVPALAGEYATGLSAWQHKVCRNYAHRHLNDGLAWLEAKMQIAELISDGLMFKKQATRKNLARFKTSPKSTNEVISSPTQISGPLASLPLASPMERSPLLEIAPRKLDAQYRSRGTE